MMAVIFLVCIAAAILLSILVKKIIINRFSRIPRILVSILTFFVLISASLCFFGVLYVKVTLENTIDDFAVETEDFLYAIFPDSDLIQNGLDLSPILEDSEIAIQVLDMLESDERMLDGLETIMFQETEGIIGPTLFDILLRPVYPVLKNYVVNYSYENYPDLVEMAMSFKQALYEYRDSLAEIHSVIENDLQGDYVISVHRILEALTTPIKAYINYKTRQFQTVLIIIVSIYIAVLAIIAAIVYSHSKGKQKIDSKSKEGAGAAPAIVNANVNQSSNNVSDNVSERDWVVALLLAIFVGGLGIHRFYVNKIGTGITMLLLSWTGISLIWALVDIIMLATGSFKDKSGKTLVRK
jgi:hypothetical protein